MDKEEQAIEEQILYVRKYIIKHISDEWMTVDKLCATIHKKSPETLKDISPDLIAYVTGIMIGDEWKTKIPSEIEIKQVPTNNTYYYMVRRKPENESITSDDDSL